MSTQDDKKRAEELVDTILRRSANYDQNTPTRAVFDDWRDAIEVAVLGTRHLMTHPDLEDLEPASTGECKANIMLAVRHLEDAKMRLGKAIQAIDGGISVYDRNKQQATNK